MELFEDYDGEYSSDDCRVIEHILITSRNIYLKFVNLYSVNFLKLYKFYMDKYNDTIYETGIDIKKDADILKKAYRNNDQEFIKFLQGNGDKLPINYDSLEIFNEHCLARSDSFIELWKLFTNSLNEPELHLRNDE